MLWLSSDYIARRPSPCSLSRIRVRGERIRDEKPVDPEPKQAKAILCVSLVRIWISVVATTLRPACTAGLLRSPRAIRICPSVRMKAGVVRFPEMSQASPLSFRPPCACGSHHALRSGPHRGTGIRYPLL